MQNHNKHQKEKYIFHYFYFLNLITFSVTFYKTFYLFDFLNMQWYLRYYFIFFLSIMRISLSGPHAQTHIQLFVRIISNEPLCQDQPVLFLKVWEEQKVPIVLWCFYIKTLLLKMSYILWPALFYPFVSGEISGAFTKWNLLYYSKSPVYVWGSRDDIYRAHFILFGSLVILFCKRSVVIWFLLLTSLASSANSCRFWQLMNTGSSPSSATYKLCAIWQVP